MQLELSNIRIDGGTQPRSKIDESIVTDYATAMLDGAQFPPVVVFFDGVDNWLADGFHRFHAIRKNDNESIEADVRTGTLRDAILYSVSANASHGLRRTNEDKRRSVLILMNDAEWSQWSNNEIGRRCGVSHELANTIRNQLADSARCSERSFVHHETGKKTQMKTENIGRLRSDGKRYGEREGYEPAEVRAVQIAELAAKGYRADQIGEAIGISEGRVQQLASEHKIKFLAGTIRAPRINNHKVLEQSVLGLEASAASLRTIGVSLEGIEKEEAKDWAASLSESIRIFNALRKKLQEHANA
jgi:hypothetical protein